MSYNLTGTKFKAWADDGTPLIGGKLYTYVSGTTANQATYTDDSLSAANTNPITLNARGEADVWLEPGRVYTFKVTTSAGVTVDTEDGISAPETSGALSTLKASLASGAAGNGSRLIAYVLSGAAAVKRWVDEKLSDQVSVKDFGAIGDGFTDDTAAIQLAINHAQATSGTVYLPDGIYKVGTLYINSHTGLNFIGSRQPHPDNKKGASLLYTGSGNCIEIADGLGGFMYRVFLKSFAIYFTRNAQSGIYGKNLQECLIEDVGVWADSYTVSNAFDLDGIGIVNIDNWVASRTVNGIKFHYGTTPNPQSTGGSNITRGNCYHVTNGIVIGYTLSLSIEQNWFEGFQNAILVDNGAPNDRTEVIGLVVRDNDFVQSTTGLTQTRAIKVSSSDNLRAIRFFADVSGNRFFMNSSGATAPSYAMSFETASNSTVVSGKVTVHENWAYGQTVAAVYNDNQKILIVDSDNASNDALFGTILPTYSGSGARLGSQYVLSESGTTITAPAVTTESVLATVNIPGYLLTKAGSLRITAQWSYTTNANTKTIRVRLADTSGPVMAQHDAGGLGVSMMTTHIINKNDYQAQMSSSFNAGSTSTMWRGVATSDSRNMLPLIITAQKAVAADTVNLESVVIEVTP